jgi:hypothetical protein
MASTISLSTTATISTGTVKNNYVVYGGGTLSINNGATLASSSPPDVVWNQVNTGAAAVSSEVYNAGLILAASSRAFDTTSAATAGELASNFTLVNTAAGTIISSNDAFRDQYVNAGGVINISNAGTIIGGTTASKAGRGIDVQQDEAVTLSNGAIVSSFSLLTIDNTGLIKSFDDSIRVTNKSSINGNIAANTISGFYNPVISGDIFITNSGTILSAGSLAAGGTTGTGAGQAIDLADVNALSGAVTIANLAGGLIESLNNDAIRPGNNGIVVNYGTIIGAQVFTSADYANPTKQGSKDGISATYDETITVTNFGTITGSKSGVYGERNPATETLASDETMTAGAPALSSTIIVNNEAGGLIIGQDGKGVGADYGTIFNAGTIIGADNAHLLRGDGDGVDVNFTVNLTNASTGVIEALGSEGVDDNGRRNIADGLAIGGGTVDNAGKIVSANNGVTVNNDGNPDGSRSGNADLVLTNEVGGVIEADGGYAIRSENKGGLDQANAPLSQIDYDTVTNYGTILSYGTIPDFSGTFEITTYGTATPYVATLTPDTHVIGTIEGTVYSSSDAGSIRFTEGDGSAIQLGEGNDILNEYGVLYAQDGRAINLEGGNNTLNLFAGASITGRIDGGLGGTNTLDLNTPNGAGATPGAVAGTLDNIIDFATLNVAGGSWTLEDGETYANGVSIAAGAALIVGSGAELVTGGPLAGALSLTGTGEIDLRNLSFSGTTAGTIGSGGVLTITQGAAIETVTFAPAMAGDTVLYAADGSGGTALTLCFYPGTRIATPEGEVEVQALRPGQMVVTANGARPVRWIGQSHIDTRFADKLRALPIRIHAGALGGGLPVRDLLLSPDHAIFLDGILVQAGALVNGSSIMRAHDVPAQFTYYHVELDSHELLLAEGVQAESFVDNAERMNFHNWQDHTTPAQPIAELPYPRAKSARQLPHTLRSFIAA